MFKVVTLIVTGDSGGLRNANCGAAAGPEARPFAKHSHENGSNTERLL